MNTDKAWDQITTMMDPVIQLHYRELHEPKELWDRTKTDFEKVIKLDGQYELAKLTSCKLESYASVT
jgi:hypothetical protein